MIDLLEYHLLALVAGLGMAFFTGFIGSFVVWRRMSYLGDSLAHSALLGIALGLVLSISTHIGIFITCAVFATLLVWMQNIKVLPTDALLGILAHGGLALGIIAVGLLGRGDIDGHAYLFGDILQVTIADVLWLYVGGAVLMAGLIWKWQSLVLMTVNEDLAKAENVNILHMRILLISMMTIIISVSVQIIGILLITSLLILPAATARQMTRTPESMAGVASIIGVIAVFIGMSLSVHFSDHDHSEHAEPVAIVEHHAEHEEHHDEHDEHEEHAEHNEHEGHERHGHGGSGRVPAGASIVAVLSFMFALVFPFMSFVRLFRKQSA